MNKVKINFDGKEIERKVYTDKKGDKYITHHNEKWLVSKETNEVIDRVTSNTVSAMWDKQNYIDTLMHHLDKIEPYKVSLVASSLNTLNTWYKKEESFLDKHYDEDSYALDEWLDYAFKTLNRERN